jgi:PKD-like domain/Secretion system C-terminal sorting domain
VRNMGVSGARPGTPGTITGTANVCSAIQSQTAVTYSINAVNGATSYLWTVPANATLISGQGTTSISVLFASAFTYGSITVRSVAPCGNSSTRSFAITKSVTRPLAINASAPACAGSSVVYSVDPVAAATGYQWFAPTNGTIVSGQGTTTVTIQFNSSFTSGTVSVRSNNACSSSSILGLVVNSSGCFAAKQPENLTESIQVFTVFPNPANEHIQLGGLVSWIESNEPVTVQLLDASGRVALQQQISANKLQQLKLGVRHLTAGVYHLRLITQKNMRQSRIVIAH